MLESFNPFTLNESSPKSGEMIRSIHDQSSSSESSSKNENPSQQFASANEDSCGNEALEVSNESSS